MNLSDFDPSTLEFGVFYEVAIVGTHPESGEPLEGEVYFVSATTPDGTRFKRYIGTWGWEVETHYEYGPMCSRRVTAANRCKDEVKDWNDTDLATSAASIAINLQNATDRFFDDDVWEYNGAVYGSESYQNSHIEEDTAAMEREAEHWG